MRKFKDIINENQTVYLDDNIGGVGFYTNKYPKRDQTGRYNKSISYLNNQIKNYIEYVYGPFGYSYGVQTDINVNGLIINGEYINKMVNNYTVFKSFIKENKIKDENTFYNLMESNFSDIYHYNGDFFKKETLPILINTTRKGNINEKKSLDKFKEVLLNRNIEIDILSPNLQEDVKGIDGKFLFNGRTYTIQVKPFTNVSMISSGLFKAKSKGSLSLGVDYLVLYQENDYIILRNPKSNPISIEGENFIYNVENILFSTAD